MTRTTQGSASSGARLTRIGLLLVGVAWLGGLLRLFGEAASRAFSSIAMTDGELRTALTSILVGSVFIGLELILLSRWSWYRDMIRQTRNDIRSVYGLPPTAASTPASTIRRTVPSLAMTVVPAALLAIIVPGVFAAAVMVVLGLVMRVVLILVAAR
jgi:hypothetical protein